MSDPLPIASFRCPRAALAAVAGLAFLAFACSDGGSPSMQNTGPAPESATPPAEASTPPVVATPATPNQPGMPEAPADLDLRKALPEDVAVYPGATPLTFVRRSDGSVLTSFSVDAAPTDVGAWFERELAQQGWKVESLGGGPDGQHALFGEKGERLLSLFVGEEEGRRVAELTVSSNTP